MDEIQLSQGYSATTKVYFLPRSPQEFLVHIWSTSEGWKAKSVKLAKGQRKSKAMINKCTSLLTTTNTNQTSSYENKKP